MRPLPPLPEWVALEHTVAKILSEQERHGWSFDERAAWQLTSSLQQELQDLEKVLRKRHPYVAGVEFTPKRNNNKNGMYANRPRIDRSASRTYLKVNQKSKQRTYKEATHETHIAMKRNIGIQ